MMKSMVEVISLVKFDIYFLKLEYVDHIIEVSVT